jgi:ABC-type phosphate transport system ATPase subunit
MRRRLDLAAALIGRPRLLFLDEPTTGLDPRRLGMWDVVRAQVREGATLLLTTQYLEEADPDRDAAGLAQPIAEWNPFSALTAATRELFGNPNPFTSGFPGEHPIFLPLVWTTGLLIVFAPLAVRKYRSIDR